MAKAIGVNKNIEEVIDDFNNDRYDLYDRIDGLDKYVLKKGELFALVHDSVDFYQEKTQCVRVRVAATTDIVSWLFGEEEEKTERYYAHMDTGTLVCTNQRLVFIGSMKTVTIPLGKIVGIEERSDGILVSKEGTTKKYAFGGILGRGGMWAAGVRSMCRKFNR